MDPYSILGISHDCSQDDIKRSYRKLSMKFHPDKNPGDETATAKFQDSKHTVRLRIRKKGGNMIANEICLSLRTAT